MFKQLPGKVPAAHGDHDLARPNLRQGIKAAEQNHLLVDNDDLLVHDINFNNAMHDGTQLCQELLETLASLELVSGIADEHGNPHAPVCSRTQIRKQQAGPASCPGCPDPDRVTGRGQMPRESVVETALVSDIRHTNVLGQHLSEFEPEAADLGVRIGHDRRRDQCGGPDNTGRWRTSIRYYV